MILSIRNTLLLWMLAGYLLFSYFFMQIRFPPVAGGGIPLGEIAMGLTFCLIYKDLRHLSAFTNNIIFVVFLMWWTLGIGRALAGVPEYGMWALRDASHVIESLFLWVGFVFAAKPGAIDHLFIWLRRIMWMGCLIAFGYPFREWIASVAPTITSANGGTATLFVAYSTSSTLMLWESARRLIERAGSSVLIPALLIAYNVGVFQRRKVYLQILAILLMLFWYRRQAFKKLAVAIFAGFLALILVAESGLEFKGRLGQKISVEFIQNHILAIAGIKAEGASSGVVGAAKGIPQRFGWWEDIFRRLLSSNTNLMFGLGYGFPLIDFHTPENLPVREPHNSTISILARIGVVGLLLFLSGHILLVWSWIGTFKLCRKYDYKTGQDRLFLLMVFFVMIWLHSIAEDTFEKPYLTIPYYFFWGVVLQFRLQVRNMFEKTEDGENRELIPAQGSGVPATTKMGV